MTAASTSHDTLKCVCVCVCVCFCVCVTSIALHTRSHTQRHTAVKPFGPVNWGFFVSVSVVVSVGGVFCRYNSGKKLFFW